MRFPLQKAPDLLLQRRANDARKLERLQERGLRAVYKDKHTGYFQLMERAKLSTFANRRLQDICIP